MNIGEIILDESVDPAWFGDSKVVDTHGDPMVCYHGGGDAIEVFRPLTHFGTSVAANQRVVAKYGKTGGGIVYPVYLHISKPLKVADEHASEEASMLNAVIRGEYPGIDRDVARRDGIVAACEAAGYDGMVYRNRMEHRGRFSWVIFRPEQVRFAFEE